jgi:DNA-binding transcriptional ArsR family regulator
MAVRAEEKRRAAGGGKNPIVRALRNDLRHSCMTLLYDERYSSPRDLSSALDEKCGKVSYHMKVLAEAGLIELVITRRVRGAVEHFYRPAYSWDAFEAMSIGIAI